jgi:hypothetical protein
VKREKRFSTNSRGRYVMRRRSTDSDQAFR